MFLISKQVESVKVLEGHRSEVNKVVVDGDFLFSASYDYSIRQWRVKVSNNSNLITHEGRVLCT